MGENPLAPLVLWIGKHVDSLSEQARNELEAAYNESKQRAEDECAYARAQVENDYDGWVSPDQLEEYYIALPLDVNGFPIHDVRLVYA